LWAHSCPSSPALAPVSSCVVLTLSQTRRALLTHDPGLHPLQMPKSAKHKLRALEKAKQNEGDRKDEEDEDEVVERMTVRRLVPPDAAVHCTS